MTDNFRPKPQTIAEPELWWLLLGQVRYAMGRMSTAPSIAQDAVRRYAKGLRTSQLAQIGREVREELDGCARRVVGAGVDDAGSPVLIPGLHLLGMQVDHDGWTRFAEWCAAEVLRRGTDAKS